MRPALVHLLVLWGLAGPAQAVADEGRLFLSWHAPYGMAGARESLVASCEDTSRVDTLYLCYETGRDAPRLYGITAEIVFWPQVPDTLGPFWDFRPGGANDHGVRVEFAVGGSMPMPAAWSTRGFGGDSYGWRPASGRLRLIYAQPSVQAAPVQAGRRYCFARLLISHRNPGLAGCRKPVCVEWAMAKLAFGPRDEPAVTRGATGHVTWNSPGGAACASYRQATSPPGKRPVAPGARSRDR